MATNNNQGLFNSMNPLSYMGVNPTTPNNLLIREFAPTQNDLQNILIGTIWLNVKPSVINASDIYMLVSKAENVANWVPFGNNIVWNSVANGPVQMITNNGYIINNAGSITITLPLPNTVQIGDILTIMEVNPTGQFVVAQNAGNRIIVGTQTTTLGAGGSLDSGANEQNVLQLVCVSQTGVWQALSSSGAFIFN